VLTLTLALSAYAGEMSTTVAPPSAPAQGEMSTPDSGEISTGVNGNIHTGYTEEATAEDAVVADVLSLVQVVLSLL
jgi:hypothetical protein